MEIGAKPAGSKGSPLAATRGVDALARCAASRCKRLLADRLANDEQTASI
jgi:hypothetical protein